MSTPEIEGDISARAWQTLFITSISVFLVAMDVTIVSVALPGITKSFHEPVSTLSWVFTAYNITFAALLLLAGKVGDRIGRKPVFLGGLAAFAVASLLAGVAPSAARACFAKNPSCDIRLVNASDPKPPPASQRNSRRVRWQKEPCDVGMATLQLQLNGFTMVTLP